MISITCAAAGAVAVGVGFAIGVWFGAQAREELRSLAIEARTREDNMRARMQAVEADAKAKLKAADQRVQDLLGRAQP